MSTARPTPPKELTNRDLPAEYRRVLPRSLQIFVLSALGLTAFCLLFALVCRAVGFGVPYSFAYYFVPGDMFKDFIGFHHKFELYGQPRFFTDRFGYVMYPVTMVVIIHLFQHPALHHTLFVFMPCMFLIIALLIVAFYSVLKQVGFPRTWLALFVLVTVVTSYPVLFEVMRANFEVIVWLFTSVGIWAFYRDRPNLAAVAIGVAISLKLYPFILLGMFLPARRYKAVALSVAVAVGLALTSYALVGPTIREAYVWNSTNLAFFSKFYAGRISHLGYDHSLFSLVKFASLKRLDLQRWVRPYTAAAALGSLVLYFGRLWRLPLPNQIVALSILSIILPPVSYDYTLLNLYPAFTVLVCLAVRGQQAGYTVPRLTAYMVLFALVFTPESYVIFFGAPYGGQVRALALIAMLVMTIRWPLPTEVELLSLRSKSLPSTL